MTPSRPRQERSERTRAHILETSAVAFAQGGFDGVSLNDVIARSGLSKGAFYFHFSSKEELALATFRFKQQEMLARFATLPGPSSIADRLAFNLRERARILREDPSFRCISRLGSQFNSRSGPGSPYATYLDAALESIADLVAAGQRRGEIRRDLVPEAVARTVFACTVGVDTLSLVWSGGDDLEARTEDLIRVLASGLTAPGTHATSHDDIDSTHRRAPT